MIISRITLRNWRNFSSVNVGLRDRVFLVGPNAAGKSNFLDTLRFLRDVSKTKGGGLQEAISERGGLSKIRCLAARKKPDVEVHVELSDMPGAPPSWKYSIGLTESPDGRPQLTYEKIWGRDGVNKIRPDNEDTVDPERLTETLLEQTHVNKDFREVARFFESVTYLHLVPQMVRLADRLSGPTLTGDPFGLNFMDRLGRTPKSERNSLLKEIERALQVAVPQFEKLSFKEDSKGKPHLQVIYKHWRPAGARQQEDQFSDGTIRLIGLFWALLQSTGPLLLEEPELSLNNDIVRQIPSLMYKLRQAKKGQVIVSTHSYALLSDEGIGLEEVLLLSPDPEGTRITAAANLEEARALVDGGMPVADAVLPLTNPQQLDLLKS